MLAALKRSTQSHSDEDQIVVIELEWFNAFQRGDWATIDRVLGDDYVFIAPTGEMLPKAAEHHRVNARPHYERCEIDEIKVRVYGNSAVLTARVMIKGHDQDGDDVSGTYRHTRVYIKQDERWRAVAGQATLVTAA